MGSWMGRRVGSRINLAWAVSQMVKFILGGDIGLGVTLTFRILTHVLLTSLSSSFVVQF